MVVSPENTDYEAVGNSPSHQCSLNFALQQQPWDTEDSRNYH